MACKVSIGEIKRTVKNRLLDVDGVTPTASGVFYSFTQGEYNISRELSEAIADERDAHNVKVYGEILETSKEEFGVDIKIAPTQELADAMSNQNQMDEDTATENARIGVDVDVDGVTFNSRRANAEPPAGNNYTEFVRHKQQRLASITNELNSLNLTLKNANLASSIDVRETSARVRTLEREFSTTTRQLEGLAKDEEKYMFHAILEDLDVLEQTLDGDSIYDINKVNDRLDFLDEFISGKNKEFKGAPLSEYNNPAFDSIVGKIKSLQSLADTRNNEIIRQTIERTQDYKNLVEGNENIDTDTLFQAQKDITWLEKWALGVTADRTNNTIIPQALYSLLHNTLAKKKASIEKWNKELKDLIDKNPELDNPEFMKEKTADGDETGFLVNLFSPTYYNAMVKYKKAVTAFLNNSSQENYTKAIDEMLRNNTVIDFTKIRMVRDIYGQTYGDNFRATEQEIDAYEASLKKGLGPKYQEVVDQILNRLALFEEKKAESTTKEGTYVRRDLAAQDIWQFNEIMKGGDKYRMTEYMFNETKSGVLFKDFNNVTFLPKTEKTVPVGSGKFEKVPTNFYSKTFQEIAEDPVKLQYWNLIKDMSEYISSTYDQQTFGRLSYPKVQKEYAERLQQGLKDKHIGSLFASTAKEYKSWFFERGRMSEKENQVVGNYSDNFTETVKEVATAKILKGQDKKSAYIQARKEVLATYSNDFNSNIVAVAMEAALHDTRLEIQPMAQASLKYFKSMDKDRTRAIEKLEHFYEKIILNSNEKYRGSDKAEGKGISKGTWLNRMLALMEKVPFIGNRITEKATFLLSDTEKQIFKDLTDIKKKGFTDADYVFESDGAHYIQKEGKQYEAVGEEVQTISNEDFQRVFQKHIQEKINDLGLDLNLAGAINGILKTVIFKGLALNPISGIFNRIEGKHSSMIMDTTGEYWTTGNIDVANNLMNFANITRLSRGRLTPVMGKRKDTLQAFDTLMKQFNILQDRKNELQRSAEESKFNRELLNPFMFAVENPEYKNQGAIVMALLMDHTVTDANGNVVPFLDKETGQFTIYDINDGQLTLKEDFRTPANIESYENFQGDVISGLTLKMTDAVSRSQGNYNALDIMMAKKSIWGRAGTLFMTWFAEHINQRFGTSGDSNYNLATGKKRRDGRYIEAYKTNKANTMIAAVTGLAVSYGIGGPLLAAAGVAGLGAYVYKKFVGTIASDQSVKRDVKYGLELAEFIRSLLVESLNYPGRILNVGSKFRIENRAFNKMEGVNMTKEEISSMRALTRELAIVLTWLGLKLAMGALLYDDEDDKDSPARMKHNFIQNQLSRTVNALTVYTNPEELVSDQSRVAALSYVESAYKVMLAVFNEKQRKDLGKNMLDVSPIPRILTKGRLPWHDNLNYDEMSNFSGIPSPMKWTSDYFKNSETGGEYSAKKEYTELRADYRDQLKEELMEKNKGKKEPLKKEIDKAMKEKFGKKEKGQSYADKLKELEKKGLR